jgi:hypothetical protein
MIFYDEGVRGEEVLKQGWAQRRVRTRDKAPLRIFPRARACPSRVCRGCGVLPTPDRPFCIQCSPYTAALIEVERET